MRKVKKLDADTLTVVSAYMRLRGTKTFLLESKGNQTASANYSIIAVDPVHEFQATGTAIYIDGQLQASTDPLQALQALVVQQEEPIPGLPFQGGAIGYVGFDTVAVYEDLGAQPVNDLNMPDMHLFVYETFIIFDNQAQTLTIVADNCYSGRTNLDAVITNIIEQLHAVQPAEDVPVKLHELQPKPNMSPAQFTGMVEQAQALITAGDMFQIVPSQRFEFDFVDDPFDFYRQLRRSNPSPYMYFLDYGPYQIIGASPESLVTVRGDVVTTNPIAGTRKRGRDAVHDQALAKELQTDEKELAEHRMLVDLGRNDIGKISTYGSVKVTRLLELEKYQYVMHLVSEVQGQLIPKTPAIEALKATLPAGTVSGAPKVRALQRLYELEPVKRGVYAGAVGYLSQDNQLDFAIAIRTMIVKDGQGYVQAGAGIVYDSIAANEYQETLNKARGLLNVGGLR
ncbi:anthranilate synthase component I [Periweissella fabaria]|uniref:Anthranilate synthase component 1 n=1 Tax=Periweissella fabaria TaxID=546157 RepID=A0ABN8BHT5_9LACO|nr:anthranilate synthase component I [Periweissella fabaria]MCM0597507.1 anthranilate synthase component I [Periweissella fabaria]CAH0415991.1 Anthranilate synthase component 1 [Periweissella fabaria]